MFFTRLIFAVFFYMVLFASNQTFAANPSTDLLAQRALTEAYSWQKAKANIAISNTQDHRQHQALMSKLAQLEMDAELGNTRLSHFAINQIHQTLEAMAESPLAMPPKHNKAVAANGTINGTIIDAATGLALTNAGFVSVQAVDFNAQTSPISTSNIATGTYSLSLPPGKYHLRTSVSNTNTLGMINQAYGFGNCLDLNSCPRYVGTIITVPDGGTVNNIDFIMPRGARVSGQVIRADTSAPVANATVIIAYPDGNQATSVQTDASGNYLTAASLPPGNYRVYVFGPLGLFGEAFASAGNLPCGGFDCNYVAAFLGSDISLAGTATASGINFSLDPETTVSGNLSDLASSPIALSLTPTVYLIAEDKMSVIDVTPDAAGNFVFNQVRPGQYRLVASANDYVGAAWLTNTTTRECLSYSSCDVLNIGGSIVVGATGTSLTGLTIKLDTGARVSGTVREQPSNAPIQNMSVSILDANGEFVATGVTDAGGAYSLAGIPAGSYRVLALSNALNYVPTLFGNVQCNGNRCYEEFETGASFTLAANANLPGIDINMPIGATITGSISDASVGGLAPRNRTRIELFDLSGRIVSQQFQGGATSSSYLAQGLMPGAYKAVFASSSVVGWIDASFGGLPCPRGGCDLSILPTVFATSGAITSGINASLVRGPIISGRVFDATTLRAIPNSPLDFFSRSVAFYNGADQYSGFASIFGDGNFVSRTGLPASAYFASTFLTRGTLEQGSGIGRNYIDTAYNNVACAYLSCNIASSTPINVVASNVGGIDFAVNQGGAISGNVTNSVGGGGLKGVRLRAFNVAGKLMGTTLTNLLGQYRIEGLPAGSYTLTTDNRLGFLDELYNDQSCEPFCNPVGGTSVAVSALATTNNINFALAEAGVISGVVSNAVAVPQANVPVEIYGQIGNLIRTTNTNDSGQFRFADLAAGRFFVRTRNTSGLTDDLYWINSNPENTSPTDPPCVGLACVVRSGSPILLGAGGVFNAANMTLAAPGIINGQVTNQTTLAAMSGVQVFLYDARGALVNSIGTSVSGAYSFGSLASGNYFAVTRATPGFVDEAFNNQACSASCDGLLSTPIAVSAGASTSAINFALSSGASISGTVQNSVASPLTGVTVQVYDSNAVPFAQIATNPSGNFEINNIPDGTFFVRTQNNQAYIDELFNNRVCNGYCDIVNGDPINVTGGASVGSVNFQLGNGGSISGQVSRAVGGSGIGLAEVQAFTNAGFLAGRAITDGSGNYAITGLPSGSYKVRTLNNGGFVNQVYRTPGALSCSPTPCLLSSGTSVTVAGSATGINFSLTVGGTISGTATDLFNNPLPSGNAVLLDNNGIEVLSNPIDNGVFEFNGIANGSYYVLIENNSGLIDLLYPNVPCPAGSCNITALGTPIVLNALRAPNQINAVANIDLRLPTGRQVAGRVRQSSNLAPLSNTTVYIFNGSNGALVGEGNTDGLGNYVSTGAFVAGNYFVATTDRVSQGAGNGLINEVYNNFNCMLNCNFASSGNAVSIAAASAQAVPNIDFDLAQGSSISGRVNQVGGGALSLVTVQVFDANGILAGTLQTNSLGEYQISGLLPGTYYARTINAVGLVDTLFGGNTCAPTCNPITGAPITVLANGNNTANINFSLGLANDLFKNGFE